VWNGDLWAVVPTSVRKLFAVIVVATAALANDVSYYSVQSGWASYRTPITDRGLHGEGQIIAVLDTGVDYDSCFFAEPDNSPPPFNTGTPTGGLQWTNVDLSRRKIIAYDFLYSCNQFPGARGCEDPSDPDAFDNTGHGTHNAAIAAGDSYTAIHHDLADSLASGAKLIVQDGGYIGGDNCSLRPGFGCPVTLTPLLDQAYKQGARIHTNSWGDHQGTPPNANAPVGNYPASARDVDAFVYAHPDMLVVFDTGNYGATAAIPPNPPPQYSVAAPGTAKNAVQVGGSARLRPMTASSATTRCTVRRAMVASNRTSSDQWSSLPATGTSARTRAIATSARKAREPRGRLRRSPRPLHSYDSTTPPVSIRQGSRTRRMRSRPPLPW
jgi:subtilisin family serine protease